MRTKLRLTSILQVKKVRKQTKPKENLFINTKEQRKPDGL